MITYEAKCSACEHIQEYQAKMSERDSALPKVCEGCGTEDSLKRIFPTSNAGFILKGGGWAKDGYK